MLLNLVNKAYSSDGDLIYEYKPIKLNKVNPTNLLNGYLFFFFLL